MIIDRFTVDMPTACKSRAEVEERLDSLSKRIKELLEGSEVDGVPMLGPLLSMTRKRADYDRLAGVMTEFGSVIEEYEQLRHRRCALAAITEDTGWIAAAVADFSDVFDTKHDPF